MPIELGVWVRAQGQATGRVTRQFETGSLNTGRLGDEVVAGSLGMTATWEWQRFVNGSDFGVAATWEWQFGYGSVGMAAWEWQLGVAPPGRGPSGLGPSGRGPSGLGPSGRGPSGLGPSGRGPSGLGPSGRGSSRRGLVWVWSLGVKRKAVGEKAV